MDTVGQTDFPETLTRVADLRDIRLKPAEILEREPGVSNLGHVSDLVTLELHDVNIVGARTPTRRRNRAAWTCVGAVKHPVSGDIVSCCVSGE